MSSNFLSPLEKAALLGAASYLSANKASIVADAGNYGGTAVDKVVAAVKAAEPKNGLIVMLEPAINTTLDGLDAEAKTLIPTEVGAAVDFLVGKLTSYANSV